MRRELQGTLERRVAAEKEAMAVVFERRRAERGREMEERWRGRRKEVEEEYERRRGEIGRREEGIRGEVEGLERRLARGLQEAKEEMVERGLGEYQGRIEEHRVGEERRYLEEVRRLEQEHNSNLSALTSPYSSSNLLSTLPSSPCSSSLPILLFLPPPTTILSSLSYTLSNSSRCLNKSPPTFFYNCPSFHLKSFYNFATLPYNLSLETLSRASSLFWWDVSSSWE